MYIYLSIFGYKKTKKEQKQKGKKQIQNKGMLKRTYFLCNNTKNKRYYQPYKWLKII